MEEFVENFNEFKEWLYLTDNKDKSMYDIIKKFEELNLDICF